MVAGIGRKDPNFRRRAIACFIEAVYLLERDRQEKRTEKNRRAPTWWKAFHYKLTQTLVDDKDGSIIGAILEWDKCAALSDLRLRGGAPKAVLALRGTLLKGQTFKGDLKEDMRFATVQSHSLGAAFAFQVGKALAKNGVFVETHLFNPPCVSLPIILRIIAEEARDASKKFEGKFSSNLPNGEGSKACVALKNWALHLYVNEGDLICSHYTVSAGTSDAQAHIGAKVFVISKDEQKFCEAHRLKQWWYDEQLQPQIHNSKILYSQLKSLCRTAPR
ncbi:GDSL esterase/lipase isoform X2 [Cinnamomum micranthum f. kanehirae]|uniref:GDSL esterase/lipase isoform X2 n=1 Tax=Cinnamomum micranthum f. kanehirae TaxID=337451 RepID=A0A3S3PTW7_9MAGN|nr:GDSL esterase/lipase isoform X2 [Cinnamomum micranthum f. kanehirae]